MHLDAAWSPKTIQKPPFICKRMNNRHSSGPAFKANQTSGLRAVGTCDITNLRTFVTWTIVARASWGLGGTVFGTEHATGILRRDRHALEAMLHVIVVKMSGIELFDMRLWGETAYALEPAVERL